MRKNDRTPAPALDHLGDFTTSARVLPISALAVLIGVVVAFVAAGLRKLIALFTNVFYGTLIGMVGLSDLLTARARILEAEQRRERVLGAGLRVRVFGRPKSS